MAETRLRPVSEVISEEFGDYVRDIDGKCEIVGDNGISVFKEGSASHLRSKVIIPQDQSLVIDKVSKDVSLDHPSVLKISCLRFFNSFIYEYRSLEGDFSFLNVEGIRASDESRKFEIIYQIIDFINHLSQHCMVSSLFTLDDLVRFGVVGSNNNLMFFDTSFIYICGSKEETSHRKLASCGCLTLEIFGGEIINENIEISLSFPAKWLSYIEA